MTLPDPYALKAQAKRLRADMAQRGTPLSHAQALETIAHQWGARDWNTLVAAALEPDPPRFSVFSPHQRVQGTYLGHPFTGQIKAARANNNGTWSITLRFDEAIDVIASPAFSNLRQQVSCVVDASGRSLRQNSDGPQVILSA
ncbi:MAG: glyoxalase superfamily protein [Pseudomonadota bacterium]